MANRDTWTVTGLDRHGQLSLTNPEIGCRQVPPDYARRHVQLAYATTAHGVQGDTVTAAHLVLGEHPGAASAYVGMTRGRTSNTAHIVAADVAEAREQWIAVFDRDRADLGAAHAAEQAAREAAPYATPRPLEQVLGELHAAWTSEADCQQRLARDESRRDDLREIVALRRQHPGELAAVEDRNDRARATHTQALTRLERSEALVTIDTDRVRDDLLRQWDDQRGAARDAAGVVERGPGGFGLRWPAVNRAREELARGSVAWQPYLPDMPTINDHIVRYATRSDDRPRLWAALDDYAGRQAIQHRPEHTDTHAAAETATAELNDAGRAYFDTRRRHDAQLSHYGSLGHTLDPTGLLDQLEHAITAAHTELAAAQSDIARLAADPAIRALPRDGLTAERDTWRATRAAEQERHQAAADLRAISVADSGPSYPRHDPDPGRDRHRGPRISR